MSTSSDVASTISHAYGVMTVVDTALRLGIIARIDQGKVKQLLDDAKADLRAAE